MNLKQENSKGHLYYTIVDCGYGLVDLEAVRRIIRSSNTLFPLMGPLIDPLTFNSKLITQLIKLIQLKKLSHVIKNLSHVIKNKVM